MEGKRKTAFDIYIRVFREAMAKFLELHGSTLLQFDTFVELTACHNNSFAVSQFMWQIVMEDYVFVEAMENDDGVGSFVTSLLTAARHRNERDNQSKLRAVSIRRLFEKYDATRYSVTKLFAVASNVKGGFPQPVRMSTEEATKMVTWKAKLLGPQQGGLTSPEDRDEWSRYSCKWSETFDDQTFTEFLEATRLVLEGIHGPGDETEVEHWNAFEAVMTNDCRAPTAAGLVSFSQFRRMMMS